MDTLSVWQAVKERVPTYVPLKQDVEVDVLIVGAGITGLTSALQLIAAGKKVAVIEALTVGGGTSGDSTGNLYVAIQPYYQTILKKFGLKTVKLVAESRQTAINFMANLIADKKINCNFHRRPWYLYSQNKEGDCLIEQEVRVLKEAGIKIDFADSFPLPFSISKAAKMEEQARFNPIQYLTHLAKNLATDGCLIFENTRFSKMENQKNYRLITTSDGKKIKASHVIMATHIPKGFQLLQTVAIAYRSYAVAVRLKSGPYPNANCWDTATPHHATSTHSTGENLDLLVVADSHHKTGQAPKNNHTEMFTRIEDYLHRYYSVDKIEYRWSAQHYQAADGLPYIGRAWGLAPQTYLATGFFADGLVYGTIAGLLLADTILKRPNTWADVYSSTRFKPLASAKKFFIENGNVFGQYIKGYTTLTKKFTDIKPNQGKILKINGKRCAVYRNDQGQAHVVSAVCPHLKGIVKWNNAEKTWDCPLHGSRFGIDGKVIEGPAIGGLEKMKV